MLDTPMCGRGLPLPADRRVGAECGETWKITECVTAVPDRQDVSVMASTKRCDRMLSAVLSDSRGLGFDSWVLRSNILTEAFHSLQ
jgi:hypothetical protein